MTDRLFDVICFGTDQQDGQPEKSRKALSVILKIDPQEVDALLSRGMITLRQGITEADAKALLAALGKIGLRCNYKPAAQSLQTLEIVPVEEESDRPQRIECPECGTKAYFRRTGEEAPEICPSCGLVFAKYQRIMQENAEREAIRRKLLQAQQFREAERQAEAERLAEADRRERLEEEIRHQLRLPKMFGTRNRLIGSATTLFLLGIGSGLLGARLWWHTTGPAPSLSEVAARGPAGADTVAPGKPGQWSVKSGASGNIDPGTQLLMSMEATAKADPSPLGAAEMDSDARRLAAFGEIVPRAAGGVRGQSPSAEHARAGGTETDTAAVRLPSSARTIEPGPDGAEALAALAGESAARGDTAASSALLAEIRSRAEAVYDPAQRTKALAQAADLLRDAGDGKQAQSLFSQGLRQADGLSAGADRAIALAALAATASRMGRREQRDTLLLQANQDVVTAADPYRKHLAVCEIAEQYGRAGQRGGALGLLDHVTRSARNVQPAPYRNALLARAALAQARLGDPNGALAAVAGIDGQEQQDAALFALIEESAMSHNTMWIAELSSRLQSPRYIAAALGLLGEARAVRSGWTAEVAQTFADAGDAARLVVGAAEKPNLLAQMGQAYVRAGHPDKAGARFQAAVREAQALTDPVDRTQALEAVADRLAAVLLTDQAFATSSMIPDPARKAEVQRHIEDARRIAAILHSGTD